MSEKTTGAKGGMTTPARAQFNAFLEAQAKKEENTNEAKMGGENVKEVEREAASVKASIIDKIRVAAVNAAILGAILLTALVPVSCTTAEKPTQSSPAPATTLAPASQPPVSTPTPKPAPTTPKPAPPPSPTVTAKPQQPTVSPTPTPTTIVKPNPITTDNSTTVTSQQAINAQDVEAMLQLVCPSGTTISRYAVDNGLTFEPFTLSPDGSYVKINLKYYVENYAPATATIAFMLDIKGASAVKDINKTAVDNNSDNSPTQSHMNVIATAASNLSIEEGRLQQILNGTVRLVKSGAGWGFNSATYLNGCVIFDLAYSATPNATPLGVTIALPVYVSQGAIEYANQINNATLAKLHSTDPKSPPQLALNNAFIVTDGAKALMGLWPSNIPITILSQDPAVVHAVGLYIIAGIEGNCIVLNIKSGIDPPNGSIANIDFKNLPNVAVRKPMNPNGVKEGAYQIDADAAAALAASASAASNAASWQPLKRIADAAVYQNILLAPPATSWASWPPQGVWQGVTLTRFPLGGYAPDPNNWNPLAVGPAAVGTGLYKNPSFERDYPLMHIIRVSMGAYDMSSDSMVPPPKALDVAYAKNISLDAVNAANYTNNGSRKAVQDDIAANGTSKAREMMLAFIEATIQWNTNVYNTQTIPSQPVILSTDPSQIVNSLIRTVYPDPKPILLQDPENVQGNGLYPVSYGIVVDPDTGGKYMLVNVKYGAKIDTSTDEVLSKAPVAFPVDQLGIAAARQLNQNSSTALQKIIDAKGGDKAHLELKQFVTDVYNLDPSTSIAAATPTPTPIPQVQIDAPTLPPR